MNKRYLFTLGYALLGTSLFAQVQVNIYPQVTHRIGDVTHLDRSKYMVLHSSFGEKDWEEEPKALRYLMEDCDVYFGRDNGAMSWNFHTIKEDPKRPGYALVSGDRFAIKERGEASKRSWGKDYRYIHNYEDRGDVMIGGQLSWCWYGTKTKPYWDKSAGYVIQGGEAIGEYMGHFLNYFYRKPGEDVSKGPKAPRYLEIVNEPLYHLLDDRKLKPEERVEPIKVFQYHNEVAKGIRKHNQDVQIGGYTVAFPYFDVDNFQRWEERMKLFYDTCGEHMDYVSVHFYDFNEPQLDHHPKRPWALIEQFRGGRLEATLDMMEQYSYLKFGNVMPIMVSEYGGRNHQLEQDVWTPERDWVFMKSFSPMMMTFMDRPNTILKAIPFIMTRAHFGATDKYPYPWRLFKHSDEPVSFKSDQYTLTDQIKFYELWAKVKGQRIAIESAHPDVMTDAYMDGNTLYVVMSNLSQETHELDLRLLGKQQPVSIQARQLKWGGEAAVIEERTLGVGQNFWLEPDAAAVIAYDFDRAVVLDEEQVERKYYSQEYLQPIVANQSIKFHIKGVKATKESQGVIRLSFARELDKSRTPRVRINGSVLETPVEYAGNDQRTRKGFYGMLEIPVEGRYLKKNNTIEVSFDDDQGHVSSVTMQVFTTSKALPQ